jgi:hypothetical protein
MYKCYILPINYTTIIFNNFNFPRKALFYMGFSYSLRMSGRFVVVKGIGGLVRGICHYYAITILQVVESQYSNARHRYHKVLDLAQHMIRSIPRLEKLFRSILEPLDIQLHHIQGIRFLHSFSFFR